MTAEKSLRAVFLLLLGLALASCPMPGSLSTPGRTSLQAGQQAQRSITDGTGSYFAVKDSGYLDVSLSSSTAVEVFLESVPKTVVYRIASASTAVSAEIQLAGFEPLVTYYKYEDSYRNLTTFSADGQGHYSYQQDLSSPHLVFIQPNHSTIFLADTGWSQPVGTWDPASRTATLTQDVFESIEIQTTSGITLNGGGHLISGSGSGFGVHIVRTDIRSDYSIGKLGVSIQNVRVTGFSDGIWFNGTFNISYADEVSGSQIFGNSTGIVFITKSGAAVSVSKVSGNSIYNNSYDGILLYNSGYRQITSNDIYGNTQNGIDGYFDWGDVIEDNRIHNNGTGIYGFYMTAMIRYNVIRDNESGLSIGGNSSSGYAYNNDFIDNNNQVSSTGSFSVFNQNPPIGGNYWSDWTGPDKNGDGFVDVPYVIPNSPAPVPYCQDSYPWVRPDGWLCSASPSRGTMGTQFTLFGRDFGPSNYWNVYVSTWRCVVDSWTPSQIVADFIHQLVPGTYDVKVVPKTGNPIIEKSGFTIMAPALDLGSTPLPIVSSVGTDVQLAGLFFGSSCAQFQVFVWSKDKSWLKWPAKVKTWSMDAVSGQSSCAFTVPSVPAGSYYLRLRNLISWSEYYDGLVIK